MRGDQAKVTMVYRGRELAHTELGRRILDRLVEDLKSVSRVERSPALDGRFMTMVFGSDRDKIKQLERHTVRQKVMAERSSSGKGTGAASSAASKTPGPAPAQPAAEGA